MFNDIVEWGKKNPWLLGGIVFVVGIIILWWFGFFTKSTATGSSSVSDYYAAEAAGVAAAAGVQQANAQSAAQIAAIQGQTDIAGITAGMNTNIASITAGMNTSIAGINAEVADTQTAANLATNTAYIDYLKQASTDAVTVNTENTGAAVDINQTNATAAVDTTLIGANAAVAMDYNSNALTAYTAELGLIENYNADIVTMNNSTGQGLNTAQPNSPAPYAAYGGQPYGTLPDLLPAPITAPTQVVSPVAVNLTPVSAPTVDPALVMTENTAIAPATVKTDLASSTTATPILYSPPPPPPPPPATITYSKTA